MVTPLLTAGTSPEGATSSGGPPATGRKGARPGAAPSSSATPGRPGAPGPRKAEGFEPEQVVTHPRMQGDRRGSLGKERTEPGRLLDAGLLDHAEGTELPQEVGESFRDLVADRHPQLPVPSGGAGGTLR